MPAVILSYRVHVQMHVIIIILLKYLFQSWLNCSYGNNTIFSLGKYFVQIYTFSATQFICALNFSIEDRSLNHKGYL